MADLVNLDELTLRLRIEDFLFAEAALLDDWDLEAWLELFTEDARYVVPATDWQQGDGTESLVLLEDDMARIRGRVARLQSRRAHREFPWSRTRRFISNVRVLSRDDREIEVVANFLVYRIRGDVVTYVGTYRYRLIEEESGFRILRRRAELDLESLRPHNTVSIIL